MSTYSFEFFIRIRALQASKPILSPHNHFVLQNYHRPDNVYLNPGPCLLGSFQPILSHLGLTLGIEIFGSHSRELLHIQTND
jgi:hypothetical protein